LPFALLITIFVHRNGKTEKVTAIDRAWLDPAAGVTFWADLQAPSVPESLILSDTMGFHPLAVEDAMSALQYPKVEAYEAYLYVVLHDIDFAPGETGFKTHDIDFFLGSTYLVTVHDGRSSAITELLDHCPRNPRILADGPVPLFHRIVDAMVDHYRPEVEKLADRLDELEEQVFANPTPALAREILGQKRDVSSLRRVTTPQRDVIARLARREFADFTPEMAFRFRDVYDHLVRIADDALIFQDRITGILDAHLSNVSNRLNEVMKVLTVVATIFMPMTVLTGMYGMNVDLPHFPGGPAAQFWWIFGIMAIVVVVMLAWFHRKRWI
jgi:magnesium transporter